MFCISCGVERSINFFFNFLNWKIYIFLKVNDVDSVYDKNLKIYLNKEVILEKFVREEKEKDEVILRKKIEWV